LSAELNKDKTKSGEIEFTYTDDYDKQSGKIIFEDLICKNKDKGYYDGVININFDDFKLKVTLNSSGSDQGASFDLVYEGVNYGKITLTFSDNEEANFTVPNTQDAIVVDENFDIFDYVTEEEIVKYFTDIFKIVGIDESMAQTLIGGILYKNLYADNVRIDTDFYDIMEYDVTTAEIPEDFEISIDWDLDEIFNGIDEFEDGTIGKRTIDDIRKEFPRK